MVAILEGIYLFIYLVIYLFICFKVKERKGSLYSEWKESRKCFLLFPSTPLKK